MPILSDSEVSCEDFSKVYNKKMEKKYRAPFSFRQTQKFNNDGKGKIDFSIFCFKTDHFTNEDKIKVKGKLIQKTTLRHLEEEVLSPIDLDCPAINNNVDPIEFRCNLTGDPAISGINILEAEGLSGIPDNKTLTNPAKIDGLILAGKEKDCSSQDCSLPTFSEGKIDDTLCEKQGILNLQGKTEGNIIDGSIFNLTISPESYGDCKISTVSNTIECYNKEEIEDNKIIIPETIVRNKDSKELFKLKKVISDTDDISCVINYDSHEPDGNSTTIETIEPFNSGINNFRDTKKSGLSGGHIVAIILSLIAAVIAITILIFLFKKRANGGKKEINSSIENTANMYASSGKIQAQ